MDKEVFFDLTADIVSFPFIMSIVSSRCAGNDPEYPWNEYNTVEVSIVRSAKHMPEAKNNYIVISDNKKVFTVAELKDDYNSEDCNPKVEEVMAFIKKLPMRNSPSHFYVRIRIE